MNTRKLAISVFFVCLPLIAYPQSQHDSLVEAVYVRSGLQEQIEQVPLVIQAGFDQARKEEDSSSKIPDKAIPSIVRQIGQAFSPDVLKKTIVEEMERELTNQDLVAALNWLDSPIGRKFSKLEKAASTPEAHIEIQEFANQLKDSPPSQERMEVLQKLDSLVKASETSAEILLNTQVAFAVTNSWSLPQENQIPLDEISAELESIRPQIDALVKSQTLLYFLYTYRNVDISELEEYVKFSGSTAGSRYHISALAGLKKALFDGVLALGMSIERMVVESRAKSEA
jgi:hypothetical protein